ncbi:MAG TPA: fatty acid--CoA ligase family protein, partial [Vicinamibacterales bacterium]
DRAAVIAPGGAIGFAQLSEAMQQWRERFQAAGVPRGGVVGVEGDYGVETIAAFLAAISEHLILVPLSPDSAAHADAFLKIAEVEWRVNGAAATVDRTCVSATHEHFLELRRRDAAGLVLFSSASTGTHKAAVHDLSRLLEKFATPRRPWRTVMFLQLDHIGGINTLLYALANGGTVVVARQRHPDDVAATIAKHGVELLPTSPSFLNLLLMSGAIDRHDLSSLRLITYGTEPMPVSTLQRATRALPHATFQQTYGLTEVGILRSKSRDSESLWVRVGGEGFETKVLDGRLWIRARSGMLGYLNAPSPFDADGFLDTGDRVEVDGEWMRILGRESEIINVGGNKVYPAEVEAVILELDGVVDAIVAGEPHPLTGAVVTTTVVLRSPESLADFKVRLRSHCIERLAAFKIPVRVRIVEGPLHSSRYKRQRRPVTAG